MTSDRPRPSRAYDLVLNGTEVGGGSSYHDTDLQKRFSPLWALPKNRRRSGSDSYRRLTGRSASTAYGLWSGPLVLLKLNKPSIRDVIAFPKVQIAAELMTMCPACARKKVLRELLIHVDAADEEKE